MVNGAALIVAAIYFYRRLIEPAAGQKVTSSVPRETPESVEAEPRTVFSRYRGPAGTGTVEGGEDPTTLPGAAAQLLGEGKPAPMERFVVGWGFVFLSLSLAVPVSPQLAGSFAALVALGSILTNGTQVAADIKKQLRAKPGKTAEATAPGAASPTTLVSFAGAAQTMSAVIPEGTGKKKKRGKPKFKVESA
jgi:hypothetical protein